MPNYLIKDISMIMTKSNDHFSFKVILICLFQTILWICNSMNTIEYEPKWMEPSSISIRTYHNIFIYYVILILSNTTETKHASGAAIDSQVGVFRNSLKFSPYLEVWPEEGF